MIAEGSPGRPPRMRASIVTISATERYFVEPRNSRAVCRSLRRRSRRTPWVSRCNRPRDQDRIGERLGADERRLDIEDAHGVLAIEAFARAVRLKCAF